MDKLNYQFLIPDKMVIKEEIRVDMRDIKDIKDTTKVTKLEGTKVDTQEVGMKETMEEEDIMDMVD